MKERPACKGVGASARSFCEAMECNAKSEKDAKPAGKNSLRPSVAALQHPKDPWSSCIESLPNGQAGGRLNVVPWPSHRLSRMSSCRISNQADRVTAQMTLRITDIREVTQAISSPIRNAYIDFSKMTSSLVAVVTNIERDGRRVVGYGFNSNGRYGQGGKIRERFAPRILEAEPGSLLDATGENLDPDRIWSRMMTNEKPGGHGDRSVAVGTIDMAVWDAVAKIAGKPLFRLLAERHGRTANPRVFVYAAGGYYYPGKDLSMLRAEMRGYLDRGYNVVKMKIGGGPIAEDRSRIEAVLKEIGGQAQLAVDANGRFDLE